MGMLEFKFHRVQPLAADAEPPGQNGVSPVHSIAYKGMAYR